KGNGFTTQIEAERGRLQVVSEHAGDARAVLKQGQIAELDFVIAQSDVGRSGDRLREHCALEPKASAAGRICNRPAKCKASVDHTGHGIGKSQEGLQAYSIFVLYRES